MKSYIATNPDILGGKPVITGTRIPIARILFLLKEGYTLDLIHEDYPQVSMKTLSAVVDELINRLDHYAPQTLSTQTVIG